MPAGACRVLSGKRGLDGLWRDIALSQHPRRDLDKELFVLSAEQINFAHARHTQEDVARIPREVPQLRISEAFAGESVKRDVGIAELIVEEWSQHTGRQGALDIANLLAHLIKCVAHLPPAGFALEVHEDYGASRVRVGLHIIELRRLLDLALDLVDHLLLHFMDRRARP